MNIRKTRKEDVPVIMDLYENAKAFMRSKGNLTQWNDGYPSVEIITEDIDNGNSYVFVENDEIVGTFAFIIGEDPTYQVIEDGEWHSSKIYGTIHRIASSGKAKGLCSHSGLFYLAGRRHCQRGDPGQPGNAADRAGSEAF